MRKVSTTTPDQRHVPVHSVVEDRDVPHVGTVTLLDDHPGEQSDTKPGAHKFDDEVDLSRPGRNDRRKAISAAGFQNERVESESLHEQDELKVCQFCQFDALAQCQRIIGGYKRIR
jgi:hypothetical protein